MMSGGNIYLVGFMGSGKTTVAGHLAGLLGWEALDMDRVLEERLGLPIAKYMDTYGQQAFRKAEKGLLVELAGGAKKIVATGGGVVEDPENLQVMSCSGTMVFLDASLEECSGRVSGAQRRKRPLWTDPDGVRALYNRRRPLYERSPIRVQVDGRPPIYLARCIAQSIWEDREVTWRTERGPCPIVRTFNAPEAVRRHISGGEIAVLADRTVGRLHLGRYLDALRPRAVVQIPPGEASKDLGQVRKVLRGLLRARIERGGTLVCVGGGVVTDLGAFVASIYKRGIDFFLACTTLLGCVDASIGGKAAVNLDGVKNAVGLFTFPRGIVLDMAALNTLPREALIDGVTEAYKLGLVASPHLACLVEEHIEELLAGDVPSVIPLVDLSVDAKVSVVEGDFREGGARMILNLGHTVGHALEAMEGYRLSHGQAVALGMKVAVRISGNRGWLPPEDEARILRTLKTLCPPMPEVPAQALWDRMRDDKKASGGRPRFVLLRAVGRPAICDDVSPEEIAEALRG